MTIQPLFLYLIAGFIGVVMLVQSRGQSLGGWGICALAVAGLI